MFVYAEARFAEIAEGISQFLYERILPLSSKVCRNCGAKLWNVHEFPAVPGPLVIDYKEHVADGPLGSSPWDFLRLGRAGLVDQRKLLLARHVVGRKAQQHKLRYFIVVARSQFRHPLITPLTAFSNPV